MRNLILLSLAAVLSGGCVATTAQQGDVNKFTFRPRPELAGKPKLTVIVDDFENATPFGGELGQLARSKMKGELLRSGYFTLLDRDKYGKSLQEMRFTAKKRSGRLGSAQPQPRRIPADVMVYGSVQNFGVKVEQAGVPIIWAQKRQVCECEVLITVVDIRNNIAMAGDTGVAKFITETGGGMLGGSSSTYDQTLAQKALRLAIQDCLEQVIDKMVTIEATTAP